MSRSVFIGPGFYSRFAFARRGPPFPLQSAVFRIKRLDEAGIVQMIAADSCNHMIADYYRSNSGSVVQLGIGKTNLPAFLAANCIQTYKVTVGRFEKEPVTIHPDTPITNRAACIR